MKYRRIIKHKFGAKRCNRGEIKFPSKLERSVYDRLLLLRDAGHILFFLRQIPVDLEGGAKHLVDFLVFLPNHCVFLEVKGKETPMSLLKRRQSEERLGVEIKVVYKLSEVDAVLREPKLAIANDD